MLNTNTTEESVVTAKISLISVIVPAYNEEMVLAEFYRRMTNVLDELEMNAELIFVNDGSTDDTLSTMHSFRKFDDRVTIIDFSRNFGKEVAMTAGFDHALGDVVVVIDADLQDPPELIIDMVNLWKEGYDMVYAQRTARDGESNLKKITARLFYRVIQSVSRIRIPEDTGDFRLLSRRSVDALNTLREHHRFMKGLFAWIGFPQKAVLYNRDPRFAGQSKFNYWKLWNFALEGITAFTIAPLKIATYLGLFIAFFSFLYSGWIFYKALAYGDTVAGYPSTMVTVTFLGGVQLSFIGILGEYIGRMFNEIKRRPLYFLNSYEPAAAFRNSATDSDPADTTLIRPGPRAIRDAL